MSYNGVKPKIAYGSSFQFEQDFTYPPVNKPGSTPREAQRTDSISIDGTVEQSITTRIDKFFDLQVDWAPVDDATSWEQFMDFALTGGTFHYHPDSTSQAYVAYKLVDKTWAPQQAARGYFKFKLRFRQVGSGSANS